jgi:hypothetical protein
MFAPCSFVQRSGRRHFVVLPLSARTATPAAARVVEAEIEEIWK